MQVPKALPILLMALLMLSFGNVAAQGPGLKRSPPFTALLSTPVQIALAGGLASSEAQLAPRLQPSAALPVSPAPSSAFGPNIRVTKDLPGPTPFENEPTLAVSPLNENNLVVASHDYNSPYVTGYFVPAVYYSFDGGHSWQGPVLLNLTYGDFASDPALVADASGNFYLSYLSINSTVFDDEVTVAVSKDGGVRWSLHTAVSRDAKHLHDKPYIAVGPSITSPGSQAIYVTYTDFHLWDFATALKVVRSDDGGKTWTQPMMIKSTSYPGLQGTAPAVAPDGTLYVAYFGFLPLGGEPEPGIFLSVSRDGGQSFAGPYLVSRVNFWTPGFCQSGPYGFRTAPLPSIAVGARGEVYVAYNSATGTLTAGPSDPSDIFFVSSSDGGRTWSRPVKVNDDNTTAGQFMPWIAFRKSDSTLHIAWIDQRYSRDYFGYDIFYASSSDGGKTWSKNQRVTDYTTSLLSTPLFMSSSCGLLFFIGDYINMAVSPSQVYVVWTDGRRGYRTGVSYFGTNEDIYFAKLGNRSASLELQGPAPTAGYGSQLGVAASGLSASAFYDLWLNNTLVASRISADASGRLLASIVLPALAQGTYSVRLTEPNSGLILATAFVNVGPNDVQLGINNVAALASRLSQQANATQEQLGLLRARLDQLEARLQAQANATQEQLGLLRARLDQLEARLQAFTTIGSTLTALLALAVVQVSLLAVLLLRTRRGRT